MTNRLRHIVVAFSLLTLAVLWVFRGDVYGDLCPGVDEACLGTSAVPCTGSTDCAVVSTGSVPGGITVCSDGEAASHWKAPIAPSWVDCHGRTGYGACARKAQPCATLTLYETRADCDNGKPCFIKQLEECIGDGATGNPQPCP